MHRTYIHIHNQNKLQIRNDIAISVQNRKYLSLCLKLPAVGCDKIVGGKKFHRNGTATKNECLNALIVEHTRFKVKE